jgi:uncharacterized protein YndB with AHSA1/START domain
MTNHGDLQVATPGDTDVVITRSFHAPRQHVWDAHTQPALVRQWLLGPPGWTMPVCEIDARVGGTYRYEWHKAPSTTMGMGGTYLEVDAPSRLVAREAFDDAWYPGEATDTHTFVERRVDGALVTVLTLCTSYESKDARDIALKTNMAEGMSAGYDRLAGLLDILTETR